MRIVQLVGGGDVAGGQLVALRLACAARQAGHEVSFVSPSDGPFLERARATGFPTEVVQLGGALDVRALLRLRAVLRHRQAELVHTHVHFSLNVLGRLAARLAGAQVLAHMHIENVFHSAPLAQRVQVALDNGTARLCRVIVAVSSATRDALVRQGYPAARIMTVHNGIEPRATAAHPRIDGPPVLLEVGRLCEVKGQRELIEALARLEDREPLLLLAGADLEQEGAFARELERHAATLGVGDRVRFLGYREDAETLIAGADVLVLPSWVEGLPLVVLEAMAAGVPVVATAVGGTPELVVDGVTGVLVPPRDPAALASALAGLLANPERARQLGSAGRGRVERFFTAEAATAQILRLYEHAA